YGGSKGDVGYWAEVTEDKGYVLSGCGTNSWAHPTPFDLMVVRTDSLGNQLWSALYGGEEEEWSRTIHTTSDGGYIAAGWTESYGNGNADIYIVRIGNKLFTAEITAADSVVTVPAGESCYYSTFLKNNTMEQRVTDAWINIILPGGGVYLLENYTELNIQPNAIYSDDSIQLNVPLSAEPGDYTFIGYVGSYPDNIIDSSFFDFTVVAPINDLFCHDNWEIIVKGASENPELVESHVIGIESYPNPFNATTTLQFFLYEENEIAVDIFDLLGRKVVNLATGIYPQGSHQLIWNASDYASGIYFYKLTTNTTSITKRITLLK
ncbi:MAG: T9SS type A sorting domain-containing protein, partial [candidate division Zixibacteria bacterium]|nr:T9SS type A sorting domain-containing protein [candidate division Zixibacteria bacterium]